MAESVRQRNREFLIDQVLHPLGKIALGPRWGCTPLIVDSDEIGQLSGNDAIKAGNQELGGLQNRWLRTDLQGFRSGEVSLKALDLHQFTQRQPFADRAANRRNRNQS